MKKKSYSKTIYRYFRRLKSRFYFLKAGPMVIRVDLGGKS